MYKAYHVFRRFFKKNALFNDIINFFASISRLEDIMRFMVCPFCLQFLDSFTFMLSQKVLSREMSFFRMKNKVFSKKLQVLILVVISTSWDKLLLLGILNWYQYLYFLLRTLKKSRPNGEQKFLYAILFIMIFDEIGRFHNGLLYTQKKFGWQVTDYTNYSTYVKLHNKLSYSFNFFPNHLNSIVSA